LSVALFESMNVVLAAKNLMMPVQLQLKMRHSRGGTKIILTPPPIFGVRTPNREVRVR